MCGRYTVYTDADYVEMGQIVKDVENKLTNARQLKTGEIFPTDLVPVITSAGAVPMVWGFPKWGGKGVVINARSETAAEKQIFRSALFSRRVAVPSTGFFEWKHVEGKKRKDKYLIRLPDGPILYMAGLYSLFQQPDGVNQARFVILTTAANASMEGIHDRMPVILGAAELGQWLNNGKQIGNLLSRPGPPLELNQVS